MPDLGDVTLSAAQFPTAFISDYNRQVGILGSALWWMKSNLSKHEHVTFRSNWPVLIIYKLNPINYFLRHRSVQAAGLLLLLFGGVDPDPGGPVDLAWQKAASRDQCPIWDAAQIAR
jgi:hypothetical protein